MTSAENVPQQQVNAEAPKVKPCCVCKPEKASRDECLLFHGQDSPVCKKIIDEYKDCMRKYGFKL